MIISIDTQKDSKEDIKKAIDFLRSLTNEPRQEMPTEQMANIGMLFDTSSNPPGDNVKGLPKEDIEPEDIRIIPY